MTLEQLAQRIGAELRGDGSLRVEGCARLDEAGPEHLSFLTNRKYAKASASSNAGAIVVAAADAEALVGRNLLIAKDAYFAWREAMVALHGFRKHPFAGVHPQASIDPTAQIAAGCAIGPNVVVEAGASVGERSVIYPHCYVGENARVGADCILFPNVTVYDRCVLGDRVTLHAGCVIGEDGFGYATHKGAHHKIPQIGIAVIEDDVEMGANCTVDRATVGETRVGAGSKFSDLVAIGHGSKLGRHNLLVAQVGIAGSTQTGDYVVMGGQVGVAGHLKIGDQAQIAAKAGVMTDVPANAQYGGEPAMPLSQAKRNVLALMRLPDMVQEFRRLQKRVDELEARQQQADQQADAKR